MAYENGELKTHEDLQRCGTPETGAICSVNINRDFEKPICGHLFWINTLTLVAILRGNTLMLKSDVFDYAQKLNYAAVKLTYEGFRKHLDVVELNPVKHFHNLRKDFLAILIHVLG